MAFPETNLPIEVAFKFDGSTWTDVSSKVRYENKIAISRGRGDWGQQVDYSRCTFTLDNNTGDFSPRNPVGQYYGRIGRNTPVRVSVKTTSVALDLPGETGDYASTPDTAALDITGDIDIRIDATLEDWVIEPDYPSTGLNQWVFTELVSKRASGDTAWALYTQRGRPYFEWSPDGTTINFAASDSPLPLTTSGRIALRVTLDVNNGAGGCDVAFYTATSISGPWTLLDSGTTTGTTSIHNSAAILHIGDAGISDTAARRPVGRVHAVQVYSGIAGTLVANPDFTAQADGTTSFADSAGRTWTLAGNAQITSRKVRFAGEVASWTPSWGTGGKDVTTEVTAAGVMRRLASGAVPSKSPMYREFTSTGRMDAGIVAYWPLEDSADATQLASAYDGHPAARITQTVTPAAYGDWVGSDAVATVTTGTIRMTVPSYTVDSSARGRVGFFAKVPAAGVVSTQRLMSLTQTGTARTWSLYVNTSGFLAVRAYDVDGTQIHDSGFGTDSINGVQVYVILLLSQSGSDVSYQLYVLNIDASLLTAVPDNTLTSFGPTGTVASYTTGQITAVRFGEDGAMNGTAFGHVTIGNSLNSYTASAGAMVGWTGETGASRASRIGLEENLHSYTTGVGSEQCGAQARSTVLELMRAAGDVDEGITAELRPVAGIRHIALSTLYNQPAALTLAYTSDALIAPLDPVDDDQGAANDVTVARDTGASARVVQSTGPLSTQPPPDGIGTYDVSYTLNLLDDTQPAQHASWRLHLGAWDETRYPQVSVDLSAGPSAIETASAVDTGARLQITSPPAWLPPDTIDLMVQGYSETFDQRTWKIIYNCAPYGPYNVGVVGDATYGFAGTSGSVLAEDLSTTETGVDVFTTPGNRLWADSATHASDFPFDVRAGGEVMTVTACASSLVDTFTRTNSTSWQSADSGQAWTASGGASGDHYTQGSRGVHRMTAASAPIIDTVVVSGVDHDVRMSVSTDQLATGADQFVAAVARYTDTSNMYMAQLQFATSAAVTLTLRKRVAGVETTLGTYSSGVGASHTALGRFYIRLQVAGSTVRCRAWAAALAEPAVWLLSVTDTSLTTGSRVGARSVRNAGNTNANLLANWDDVELLNPQTLTVTRSVNTVVKAQSSGTAIALAHPAYTAL
ncbi:hypothetical protein [Streptomyces sp. NPDC057257]|uniref:hypothetical protein n=1 Tax=Streptomyces sp. NPDC057257 TaxID=3346071 RepID=UPI003628BA8C